MKNNFLGTKSLMIILLFVTSWVNGQVLISNVFDEAVFFGPDNIDGDKDYLKSIYLEDLGTAREELAELYQEEDSARIAIESLEKMKKRDKVALSEINRSKEQISLELQMIDSLINRWSKVTSAQELLLEAKKALKDENCIEFKTAEDGVYYSDDVDITEMNAAADTYYEQIITITKTTKEPKWIKVKVDETCLSDNPEDCKVWCLREMNYYFYQDMKNDKYDDEMCPFTMEYDENLQHCSGKVEYDLSREKRNRLQLVSISGEKELTLTDWKIVNCE